MADNTRKTSNVIHDIEDIKSDVSNNSQNIANLDSEAIKKINGVEPDANGNITLAEGDNIEIVENTTNNNLTIKADLSGYAPTSSLYDKAINLSAINGVQVTKDGNTSGNNQSDQEWEIQANYTEIKDNINLELNDLTDVSNISVSKGDVLTYNGSMWTAAESASGGGTFKTINGTEPDDNGNFNIINGTGINAATGTNNLTLECTITDTDTGITTLKSGVKSVDGGAARTVEFTSSDASVQFDLNSTDNTIDLTVPAAGLEIKGFVDYSEPQTEADGTYTDTSGKEHTVLWLPSQISGTSQLGRKSCSW